VILTARVTDLRAGHRAALILSSAIACAGCGVERPAAAKLPAVEGEMPRLELVHRGDSIVDSIADRIRKIAVGGDGQVALIFAPDATPRIRFVDSMGRLNGGAGPGGPGPGEIGFPPRTWWIGDTLIAYETGRLVEIRYSKEGKLLGERPIRHDLVPLAAGHDGVLEFNVDWAMRRTAPTLMLRTPDARNPRVLLDARHPQLRKALDQRSGVSATYPWPIVAIRNGIIALLDPRAPVIWYFNVNGDLVDSLAVPAVSRVRGPIELTETIGAYARVARSGTIGPTGQRMPGPNLDSIRALFASDRPPIAAIHGLNFDGRGRLWIVGSHRDSTRAIVISGTRVLGELILPCYRVDRFVSVSDRWLALLCADQDGGYEPPFELQLYRIVEPAPPARP